SLSLFRHGARLDVADKNWHLTSPTPYDPPLSYGGWLQSRALGARIIEAIQSLDDSPDSTTQGDNSVKSPSDRLQKPKPKRRIIIHTSPFTRCLQTAIAVSSGICQNSGEPEFNQLSKVPGLVQSNSDSALTPGPITSSDHRCLLRVDAFLGEWLCPRYFDEIIPPPNSDRMITAAKLELLRREHNFVPEADIVPRPSAGFFPGGWGSASTPVSPANDVTAKLKTEAPPSTRQTQAQRSRAGSCDTFSAAETTRGRRLLSKINTNLPSIPDAAYVPPTPSYAISPSDPIPAGYVTHARDACVKIDFQWDSMHGEQNWGDGGQYGEEWSTMHTRFSTGLDRMIAWYRDYESTSSGRPRRHSQMLDSSGEASSRNESDDDTETILVLITHGAGCNALVSALSGEQSQVNFGTASLTLAVRNDHMPEMVQDNTIGGPVQTKGANEPASVENYAMKMVASTEHLRIAGSTSRVSSPSQVTSPSISSYRNRLANRPSMSQGMFIIGPSSTSGPGTRLVAGAYRMPSVPTDGLSVTHPSSRTGPPHLRLIHYNDVYHVEEGSAEPVGGVARFQSVVNYYRNDPSFSEQPNVLTFFSGDAYNPSLESTVTKGRHMVPFLNKAGTDVACVGNHDLDFGVAQFRHLRTQCRFPWLLANVLDLDLGKDVPIANCEKTLMLTSSNGIKVGVIGLGEREWLGTINALPPNLVYKSAYKTALELVPRLREQGAELIVAVTHQREPNDYKLAQKLPPGMIDIILGGHDHFYAHAVINGTHVLRSGTDFKQLSYIEAWRKEDGEGWDFSIVRRDIVRSIPEDPTTTAMVDRLTSSLAAKLEKPIGYTTVALDGRFSTVRQKESNLGNFACDLMRFYYGADCAIMAGGTIRGDQIYPPGILRLKDILNCFPFEDPVVLLRIKGRALFDALENGVSQLPALEGRFTQVSNIAFSYNPSAPSGSRINWAQVGGEPIDFDGQYTLATRGYMARGKDGFASLLVQSEGGEVEEIVDEESGILISTLLRQYFLSLRVLGRWRRWGPSMTRHWSNVHDSLHCNGWLKPPSRQPSPESNKVPYRPPLSRSKNYYYGRFPEIVETEETGSRGVGLNGEDESMDSDSDTDPDILTSPRPTTNYVTLPARSATEEERRLRLARKAVRTWMHRTGLQPSPINDADEVGEFTPTWTPGISPRLEQRIVI
ncbi:hypothetical protein ASPNIDRAFT_128775, partial [Aspergillus niger ATCC 1015]